MQSLHTSIIRNINNSGPLSILTAPTHERYQSNWQTMPHIFYLFQSPEFVKWKFNQSPLPKNHILLDGFDNQVKLDMEFDIILSQNKFGQFQKFKRFSDAYNIPLISLEHTLPVPAWTDKYIVEISKMRGDINVFISEYSVRAWKFDIDDSSVRIIRHGVDTDLFKPAENGHNDGKVLTVVNDYINRDWCCGWSIYKEISETKHLKDRMNPIGNTPGFSQAAPGLRSLISSYQNASVFLNTSTVSPIPTALIEAAACGCPIVSTDNCAISELIKDGHNGFLHSKDPIYLADRVSYLLENPEKAKIMGQRARETVLEKFSLDKHIVAWKQLFDEVVNKPRIYA